jgi:hypothetical protein
MKSQKQSNRTPRPFKNKNSGRDWSGGSQSRGFIPTPMPKPTIAKKSAVPSPTEAGTKSDG